jgi:hypothetical protein
MPEAYLEGLVCDCVLQFRSNPARVGPCTDNMGPRVPPHRMVRAPGPIKHNDFLGAIGYSFQL